MKQEPFKSGVTDYAAIRKRWRELGTRLPEPKKPEPTPPPEPAGGDDCGDFDYGCSGTGTDYIDLKAYAGPWSRHE